jgi:hypothetical protein
MNPPERSPASSTWQVGPVSEASALLIEQVPDVAMSCKGLVMAVSQDKATMTRAADACERSGIGAWPAEIEFLPR